MRSCRKPSSGSRRPWPPRAFSSATARKASCHGRVSSALHAAATPFESALLTCDTASFRNNPSRNSSSQNLETAGSFAPPSSIQRSDSRNHSKLIHQKDKIIEGLRLELAEVQIKLVEMENAGGGRMRELEKQLLETRMTNAR